MATPKPAPEYVLGQSEIEQKRLIQQAEIVGDFTETFFRAAGITAGMRVLDVGCGMGDVSLLAAKIVGPTGSVLGIDRDAITVEKARMRATECISFQPAEVDQFSDPEAFDAVVGRYVLLYQSDPAATLRGLAKLVRPGGVMVFHEMDFSVCPSWPVAPLWDSIGLVLAEAFRRAGAPPDFGMRLARTFVAAGLPRPTIRGGIPAGGEPGSYLYGWFAETVRSLMPRIEAFGLATAAEIDIDTLAARMEAEAVALGSQLRGPLQFGAWIHM